MLLLVRKGTGLKELDDTIAVIKHTVREQQSDVLDDEDGRQNSDHIVEEVGLLIGYSLHLCDVNLARFHS